MSATTSLVRAKHLAMRRYAMGFTGSRQQRKLNKRQKREVKQIVGRRLESKYFDFGFGATGINSTPSIVQMSAVPQGAADSNRVGDTLNLKKLTVRMQFVGGDIYNTVRVIFFRFKQDTAVAAPTVAEIYDNTATGSTYVLCPAPNLENQDKFHIIYDKVITLPQMNNGGSTTNTSNSVKTWVKSFYGRRLGPKRIRFTPATTSGWGHIYIAVVSDSIIAPAPTVYLNARMEYTDA